MVKKKEVKLINWLKTEKAAKFFAMISLIFGFLFMGKGVITGNVVFSSGYSLNPFPVIGVLLILCSIILGIYSLKKR